jgi:hypothetical protein
VISVAHARVLAHGTQGLSAQVTAEAEAVLVEAAARLDPPRLRRVLGHLRLVADPDGEYDRTQQRHARRGLWLAPTFEGMVAVDGLLEPETGPGRPCWPPWNLWPAPTMPRTPGAAANAPLMRWPSWPAAVWRGVGCRRRVGSARS